MQGNNQELWAIGYKVVLSLFMITLMTLESMALSPWYILVVLLFFCLNLSVFLLKNKLMKQGVLLLSLLLLLISSYLIDPLFMLLFPINVYEWMGYHTKKSIIGLIPAAIPVLFLPAETYLPYGFIALVSFLFHALLTQHLRRVADCREEIDTLRERVDTLNQSLDESNAYIRQSEYVIKLEERNRISQDIHDQIGHAMTGALMQMEASKRLLQTDPVKSKELLDNAIQISKDGIESIRLVLKNMKPPREQLGIHRMKRIVDEFSARHTIKAVLTHEGDLDYITANHWHILMTNTQEAMTNVLKYSQASGVKIHIQVMNRLIRLAISDNGQGARKVIKGLGIIGMEERAARVNGTVIADGSQGFSVTTLLPYQK